MSRGRRVCAAIAVAAAFVVCWFCLSAGPSWADEEEDAHFILFSGRDIWRNGVFLYGGVIWGPSGIDEDGLLLKLLLSGGLYRYNAASLGGNEVVGAEGVAAIMPGWRIKRGPVEVKVFFGPEYQKNRLWPDDPSNRLNGQALGVRFAAEL